MKRERVFDFVRRTLHMHVWVYRNPSDRKCKTCGRHEQEYTWNVHPPTLPWWEALDEGTPNQTCNV